MGLTEVGYQRRTYDDILNDKIQRARELFGEDIDTSDLTPLGKFIRINAYDQAIAEEEIEAVYYSRFPNTAFGQSLDRLVVFGGLSRNPASPAAYTVLVHGVAGATVPIGFLVGTDADLTYYTVQAAEISEDGTCVIEVECTEAGAAGNVNANAINRIINPDVNIISVEGKQCISVGRDAESDTDLRLRFAAAIAGSGSGNENAIKAAILRVPTVQYAAVIVNNADTADSDGRPPHSFECYVLGGDEYEQEIAQAIFDKRPVGIQTVGDKTVTILDASGNERSVKYSPALNVMITVRTKIKTTVFFPDDGIAKIQSAVSNYINGIGIGNSLVLSAIYGHIYGVEGVQEVVSLELSTNGGETYSVENVTVPEYGVAICASVLVEVTSS